MALFSKSLSTPPIKNRDDRVTQPLAAVTMLAQVCATISKDTTHLGPDKNAYILANWNKPSRQSDRPPDSGYQGSRFPASGDKILQAYLSSRCSDEPLLEENDFDHDYTDYGVEEHARPPKRYDIVEDREVDEDEDEDEDCLCTCQLGRERHDVCTCQMGRERHADPERGQILRRLVLEPLELQPERDQLRQERKDRLQELRKANRELEQSSQEPHIWTDRQMESRGTSPVSTQVWHGRHLTDYGSDQPGFPSVYFPAFAAPRVFSKQGLKLPINRESLLIPHDSWVLDGRMGNTDYLAC
jgi:hypothetical protein